jgi:hypothetical protein
LRGLWLKGVSKEKMKSNYRLFCYILTASLAVILFEGCALIGVLGTPTPSEKMIPAEFKFVADKSREGRLTPDKKLLVLVNQPSWLNAPPLLRQILTEQIQERLIINAGLKPSNMVSYESLSEFRSKEAAFSSMTAAQIGKALNADLVLIVDLTAYRLVNVEDSDYFGGSLSGCTFLIDVASSDRLWPADVENKKINVAFDVESHGQEAAFVRLAAAFAHCTTRFFHDCPSDRFKIAEDKSDSAWSQWGD